MTAVLVLAGSTLLAAGGLMALALWSQRKLIRARLEALERSTWRLPGEPPALRRARLFRRFQASNRFEADNIVRDIVFRDEYGIRELALEPDDVVIDVGAHIGVFSYLCHVLGSRRIYGFEPLPENFELLRQNVGALDGVHLFRRAVWRSDGSVRQPRLALSGPAGENTGACTVMAGGWPLSFPTSERLPSVTGSEHRVATIPLDAILGKFQRVRLLKLDCEGSEFPILLTSRELHRVDRLVAEVHEIGEAGMAALVPESRVRGYTAYRLDALERALESGGFDVRTRSAGPAFHLLDARRAPAPEGLP